MGTLLSLDIATNTGFAFGLVGEGRKPTKSGVVRFEGSTTVRVCARALIWANTILQELQPDEVVIEAPFLSPSAKGKSNPATMKRLIGIQSIVASVVFLKFRQEPSNLAPQTVRKHFLGKGNAPQGSAKLLVHSRCCELGWANDETGFDETDAIALWAARACQISLPFRQSFDAHMPANAEFIMRDVKAKLDAAAARKKARANS